MLVRVDVADGLDDLVDEGDDFPVGAAVEVREEVVEPVEQGDALLERVGRADPERVGEVVVDLEGGADLEGVPLVLGVFVRGAEALCVLDDDIVALDVVLDVPERLGGMLRVPEGVVD